MWKKWRGVRHSVPYATSAYPEEHRSDALAALAAVAGFAIPATCAKWIHAAGQMAAAGSDKLFAIGACIYVSSIFIAILLGSIVFAKATKKNDGVATPLALVMILVVAVGCAVELWGGWKEEAEKRSVKTPAQTDSAGSPVSPLAAPASSLVSIVIINAPSKSNAFQATQPVRAGSAPRGKAKQTKKVHCDCSNPR